MRTIEIPITLTLNETTVEAVRELLNPLLAQRENRHDDPSVRAEARLRASRNAIFAGQKPPDERLLVDSREAARLLKVSERTLWTMQTSGQMPPPIRLGRAVRWNLDALRRWVDDGCPVDPCWGSRSE